MLALSVVLSGMRLLGYVAWSWVWVLAPLWGPAVLLFTLAFTLSWLTPFDDGGVR